MPDIVYVVTNPAIPGMVKIGYTSQADAKDRIAQLYSTGVPVPFDLEYAARVDNAKQVEDALHTAFAPYRINPKREFFRIEPEQAIVILRLLQRDDATAEVKQQAERLDPESIAAAEQMRKRRPNMNFQEMGIPIGATLYFTQGDSTVIVVGPRKVKFGEEEMSLTAVTRQLKQLEDADFNLPPAMYWTHEGKLLRDIYNETYQNIE
jgi:hypothetical protein